MDINYQAISFAIFQHHRKSQIYVNYLGTFKSCLRLNKSAHTRAHTYIPHIYIYIYIYIVAEIPAFL